MLNKNIIAVTNLIKLLRAEDLLNEEIVINLIRAFGLVQWGPPVFGADEVWKNRTSDMAGIYQIPKQLAEALIFLSDKEINSFCEIGTFQGGSFIFMSEYLRKFNPAIKCLSIEINPGYISPEVSKYVEENKEWLNLKICTSEDIAGSKFDLVFIDGNHIGGWIEKDWNNVGKYSSICMFHDIQEPSCSEVVDFWNTVIKPKYEIYEFTYNPTETPIMGIGITFHKEKSIGEKGTRIKK